MIMVTVHESGKCGKTFGRDPRGRRFSASEWSNLLPSVRFAGQLHSRVIGLSNYFVPFMFANLQQISDILGGSMTSEDDQAVEDEFDQMFAVCISYEYSTFSHLTLKRNIVMSPRTRNSNFHAFPRMKFLLMRVEIQTPYRKVRSA